MARRKKKEWLPFRYYNVTIVRVIDGDTVEAQVDVGFHMTFKSKFRLKGVNTPERKKPGFSEATDFTQAWVDEHNGHIEVETMEKDSFGRWIAMFRCQKTGEYLNKRLIEEGHSPADYKGGVEPYIRCPRETLHEELSVMDLQEAKRLKDLGFLGNRTKEWKAGT